MNSYGQQFHQFQLNEQSLQIIEHKINPQNIALKIQVLVWDRHKNVLPYGGHGMIIVTQVALAYFYRYYWPTFTDITDLLIHILLTYFYIYYWATFTCIIDLLLQLLLTYFSVWDKWWLYKSCTFYIDYRLREFHLFLKWFCISFRLVLYFLICCSYNREKNIKLCLQLDVNIHIAFRDNI